MLSFALSGSLRRLFAIAILVTSTKTHSARKTTASKAVSPYFARGCVSSYTFCT